MKSQTNIPYAVVTGRVFPLQKNKTLDTVSGMPAVISKQNTKEHRWSDALDMRWTEMMWGKLDINDNKLSPALQYVPFSLSNPNTTTTSPSGTTVMVDDISNGQFDNLLLTAKATYIPAQLTITGLIASFLRGFHSVGVETNESVLPVGTVITVIGEVTKLSGQGGDGQGFRVGKAAAGGQTTPYILTTKNIMEVKSSLRTQATIFKVMSILFGCFTIMTFYALGKKWLPRFRLRRVQRIVQRQRNLANVEGLHEAQICVACLQNPREVALFPCGHVCVCADCSLRIQERCPVCRESVAETVAVYLA